MKDETVGCLTVVVIIIVIIGVLSFACSSIKNSSTYTPPKESFSDYAKRTDPEFYKEMEDRYNSKFPQK